MKTAFLDKLFGRLDRLDPASLQSVLLKLSREKGFLETLFNTIQEGILVTDAEGRIRYLNTAAASLLGLDPDTVDGDLLARHLRDLDWDKIWSHNQPTGRKVLAHEVEVFYPQHRFLSFYIVPVVDNESSLVTGLAFILRDVTEAHRQTASTIESEKLSAITLLAAGVAHEIGNPLNSLNIHLQLLERDLKGLPAVTANRLRANIRTARAEIARLDRIIHQFLRAVRPTKPDLQRASLNGVIIDTLALADPELRDRDILVEQELAPDLPQTMFDPTQVKQAVYNLIKNALQAMRDGGILRLRTYATTDHAVIEVRDTGHGIAPDQISRIFEPYYTTKHEGSGLGLMIVQRILREHGGTLEVESNVNHGTTVRLKFPLAERRARLLPAGAAQEVTA